jgi:nucleotide-binding universal stress UspA family protein
MFRSILVPLDGSTFAEHAMPLALSIARHAGATLRLVRVLHRLEDIYFWAPMPGDTLETQLREHSQAEAQAYLEDLGRRLGNVDGVRLAYDVLEQGMEVGVTECLRADVVKGEVDLVVMTTHGRGTVARVWLGSVADELVRSLSVPLILVRPEPNPVADLGREVILRHILLALDGSPLAERMLGPAETLGKAMGADFTLLRVIQHGLYSRLLHPSTGAPALAQRVENVGDELRQEAEVYLEKVAAGLRADGLRVQTRVVAADHPAAAILGEAAASADLIALETHGRRWLSRFLMGSTADKVVRGGSLPVLVSRNLQQ